MSNFTPGPWKFDKDEQFGDMRFYVSQQDGAPYTPHYSDVASLIAETCSGEWLSIQEANARLISAAPELLAALQLVIKEGLPVGPGYEPVEAAARAAIAKSTGGAA